MREHGVSHLKIERLGQADGFFQSRAWIAQAFTPGANRVNHHGGLDLGTPNDRAVWGG
jgi:hypothetical protein